MSVSRYAYQPSKCEGQPCIGDCDRCPLRDETTLYRYGMRLRGYSIGCQPKGCIDREDDESGRYYDIITYDRELTEAEMDEYELDFLGEV